MTVLTQPTSTTPAATPAAGTTRARTASYVVTGLVLAFLTVDVVGKLVQPDSVVEATTTLGFPASSITAMGVLLAVGVVLHAVPRTCFLGAVWLTAYLGGAVCANVRAEQPLVGFVLAPVYVAVLVWGALAVRSPRLRELVRCGS